MVDKIEKLTPEQEAMIPVIRDEFIAYGLSTEPADWKTAEEGLNDAYVVAGFTPPKLFLHYASPKEGSIAAAILNDNKFVNKIGDVTEQEFANIINTEVAKRKASGKKENMISPSFCGQHDVGWVSFYNFFDRVCDLECAKKFEPLTRVAKSAGWIWMYKDVCIITGRPDLIKRDNENRLHNETGPAIHYRDGFAVYCWHGVRIPDDWIEDKANLSPQTAISWSNIEQRRCAMEILGWANVLRQLNAKVIDTDGDPEIGELIEVNIPDIGKERFLRVLCGTKREFCLPVPPTMKTALEAQAWTWDSNPKDWIIPEVRT